MRRILRLGRGLLLCSSGIGIGRVVEMDFGRRVSLGYLRMFEWNLESTLRIILEITQSIKKA